MLKPTTAGFFLAAFILTSCSTQVDSATSQTTAQPEGNTTSDETTTQTESTIYDELGFRFTMPAGLDEPSLDNQTKGSNGVWKLKFGPLNPTGTEGCTGGDCYAWTLSSVPPSDPSRKLDEITTHPDDMELVWDKVVNGFRMIQSTSGGECKSVNTVVYMPERTVNVYAGCSLYDEERTNDYDSVISSIRAL
jgi:hypothetical protein